MVLKAKVAGLAFMAIKEILHLTVRNLGEEKKR